MDELRKLAIEAELLAKKTSPNAQVWIYSPPGSKTSVYMTDAPADSGFRSGETMSPQEFIRRARKYTGKWSWF